MRENCKEEQKDAMQPFSVAGIQSISQLSSRGHTCLTNRMSLLGQEGKKSSAVFLHQGRELPCKWGSVLSELIVLILYRSQKIL